MKTTNGNPGLLVTDVYDFNKNDKSDLVQVAYERQEKDEIKLHFIRYCIWTWDEKSKTCNMKD